MIQEVTMYQAVCDGCGKTCPDYDGIIAWETRRSARLVALDSGWLAVNHCLYCPDCVEYDEETGSYKPKKNSYERDTEETV